MSETFTAVFVCTGNRFRSPLAAAAFRASTQHVPVAIRSFGTLDLEPMRPLEIAVEAATRLNLDLADHRSRSLEGAELRDADLVIGFERMHVVTAVVDAGARREVGFTLPELASLLELVDAPDLPDPLERARWAIELASRRRSPALGEWQPRELKDPLGEPVDVQRRLAEEVHELTARLAAELFGPPGRAR